MARGFWVALYRSGVLGASQEVGYSFHPLQAALLGMAALPLCQGLRDVHLSFLSGLGGLVVKFGPSVSGLEACVARPHCGQAAHGSLSSAVSLS